MQKQKQPPEVFYEKPFLNNFAILTEKTSALESPTQECTGLQKRDSDTGVFL